MKKYISLIIAYIISISCVVSVAAQNTATIVSEVINQDIKEEQMILIYINNNPGIMGFKLHFEYPEDAVEIISVHKGEVTSSGNFNNNIGNKNGSFDVMWNNTIDTILNGIIAVLKIKVRTDEPFKIKLSFSQADTFNGNYEDVVFKCNDIVSSNSITETETTVETVTKNEDEVIDVTDDVIFDIVTDELKENDITDLEDINQNKKEEILNDVNEKVENVSNQKDYYTNFEDLEEDYKTALKENLLNDIDSLETNETSKEIVEKYKEENNYENINKDNVGGLIETFEKEGLATIYSDYLTDEELQEVFNSVSESENVLEEEKSDNSYLYTVFFVVLFAVLICVALNLRGRWKKREKQQN